MNEADNPFASTSNEAAYVEPDREPIPQRSLSRAVVYWTLICCTSAIPSFGLGTNVVQPPWGIPAMTLGVLLFIGAYVLIDRRYLEPIARRNHNFRTAMLWGLGLRVTASLLVPVGVALDVLPGILSVGIVQTLLPAVVNDPGPGARVDSFPYPQPAGILGFVPSLLTTLLQGLFMNGLLWPLILALYVALNFFRGEKQTR
jgi:hypothetical protein